MGGLDRYSSGFSLPNVLISIVLVTLFFVLISFFSLFFLELKRIDSPLSPVTVISKH